MSTGKLPLASLFTKKDVDKNPAKSSAGLVGMYLEFDGFEGFINHLRLSGVSQCKYGTVHKVEGSEIIYYGVVTAAYAEYVAIFGKKLLSATVEDLETEGKKIEELIRQGTAGILSLFHNAGVQVQQGVWRIQPPSYLP